MKTLEDYQKQFIQKDKEKKIEHLKLLLKEMNPKIPFVKSVQDFLISDTEYEESLLDDFYKFIIQNMLKIRETQTNSSLNKQEKLIKDLKDIEKKEEQQDNKDAEKLLQKL